MRLDAPGPPGARRWASNAKHVGFAALLALALASVSAPRLAAQDTEPVLAARQAAEALARAAVAMQEAEGADDRVAALTQTVHAYDQGMTALVDGVRQAAVRERAIGLALEARSAEITGLAVALGGLDRSAGPLLLAHPEGPLATVRSQMLLAELAPALKAEATTLGVELEEVAMLRSLQEGSRASLTEALQGAEAARQALAEAIAARPDLPRRLPEDPEALAALLAGAGTAEALAAAFLAVPLSGPEPAGAPVEDSRGKWLLPVEGAPLSGFGEPDATGANRPGFTLAVRPLALVTAPVAGTVRHAGGLADYGNVIVLEPAAGYLLFLGGLGVLYASPDTLVAAGDPLGLIGGRMPDPASFLGEAQQGGGGLLSETLYIELREDGAPVDPGEWFAPRERMRE